VARLIDTAGIPLASVADQLGLPTRTAATMLVSIPAGFFSAIVNVAARAVLLEVAPDDARGQVFAMQGVIGNAGALIPTLLAGIAVDLLGARPVAIVLALSLLVATIAAIRYARALPVETKDAGASVPSGP